MSELELNGQKFRTGRLNAMEQWHILRRLAPLLPGLASIASTEEGKEVPMPAWDHLTEALSSMSNEDSEYIIKTCLKVARVNQDGQNMWVNVMSPGGAFMFELDLPQMFQLVVATVEENILPFFSGLRQKFPAGAPPPPKN